jgi:hypothetical protein
MKWPGRMNVLIRFVVVVVVVDDVNPDFSHIWVWCEESETSNVQDHSIFILMMMKKSEN